MTTYIHKARLDSHFTVTYNANPADENLTWGAKGILWYILSMPDNWKIKTWHLASIYQGDKKGGGKDAIAGFLKELRENGYIVYEKARNEKGHWEHHYHVYPMRFQEYQKKFPEAVVPDVDKPDQVVPDQVNAGIITSTDLTRTELESIDIEGERGKPPPPPNSESNQSKPEAKKAFGNDGYVKLTDEEYQKLSKDIPNINTLIEKLNDYIGSTGKKYKSHYSTLRSWHRKDNEQEYKGTANSYQQNFARANEPGEITDRVKKGGKYYGE